ncbi:MAG: hypothetical protein KUG78_12635 [Kangiellaceae bacterium]|nr:hypothetical protein [Kangiellaceae bacterium]
MNNTKLIKEITEFNRNISRLAEAGKWDALFDLSIRRDKFIKQYFSENDFSRNKNNAQEIFDIVRKSDTEIESTIALVKQKMIKSSLNLKLSHSAINSYRTTQGN